MPDFSRSTDTSSPRSPRGASVKALLCTVVVVVVAVILLIVWRNSGPLAERDGNDTADDKRRPVAEISAWEELVQASPYRNVRQGVRYVRDETCAECHSEIADAYAKHPMGRSLNLMAKADPIEQFTAEARHPLEVDGFKYQVRREGDRQFHQEIRLSPSGEEALTIEFEAVYAVGSGHTGRSYLIERDAHLFMSPLTWYADHGWDLSPGYEVNNSHFNRPVVAECLFCHANRADHIAGTLNEYKPPIFSGHAIGCQRCHGPGGLHVEAQEQGRAAERDMTIVNPAKLEPRLRESVCQQCHLGGLVRVEVRGRHAEDYRPGLPWSAVEAVYLSAGTGDSNEHSAENDKPVDGARAKRESAAKDPADRFVGHVEQMHQSGCYIGSGGKLGCISCHDPHRLPEEAAKVEFYRGRCLQCHGEADCKLLLPKRREHQSDDSCYACHMPRAATQIRHAAVTDHRIPRSREARRRPAIPVATPDWSPLIAFDRLTLSGSADDVPPPDKKKSQHIATSTRQERDDSRNLAIALVKAIDKQSDAVDERVLPQVLTLLKQIVERDPADVAARDAYAVALARDRELPAALRQMEEVIKREPRSESAVAAAASMLVAVRQWSAAAELWNRAREINPWITKYWSELALCQARLGRWDACTTTCEAAVKWFPDSFGARQLLIECRLVAGRKDLAEQEYQQMLKLNPPKADSVRQWWEEHPLRRDRPRRE